MPEPRAMNISVFVDDVTAANGPLLFIPKSHKFGVVEAGHDLETTSYPLWTLDRKKVKELAENGGCVAPTGPAGSMLYSRLCLFMQAHQTYHLLEELSFIYLFVMLKTI